MLTCNDHQMLSDPTIPGGAMALISIFQKLFGSQGCPNIVKYNDFTDFAAYFVQKVASNPSV